MPLFLCCAGRNSIFFESDQATVCWTFPSLAVGGLVYGTRTMEFVGAMTVTDSMHNLELSFKFDGDSKKGGWFGL